MDWIWPLPNWVPWKPPVFGERGLVITGMPHGHPVHAVSDGEVLGDHSNDHCLTLRDGESTICYEGLVVMPPRKPGENITRGEKIGFVMRFEGVSPPERALTIRVITSGCAVDCAAPLRAAWSRVTDRFHRDVLPPPTDAPGRRKLIRWILDHPLWSYPVKVNVPPPESAAGSPEGIIAFRLPGNEGTEESVLCGGYPDRIECEYTYVDPTCEQIWNVGSGEDTDPRNTDFRVWIEAGGWFDCSTDPNYPIPTDGWNDHNRWIPEYDIHLDCGGATMEEALLSLAQLVQWHYGEDHHDRPNVPKQCEMVEDGENHKTGCTDAGDGFCIRCGYLVDAPDDED